MIFSSDAGYLLFCNLKKNFVKKQEILTFYSIDVIYMNMENLIAHIVRDTKGWQIHDLLSHLENTANLSKRFADVIDLGEVGYILGYWHDIGKAKEDFQQKMQNIMNNGPNISAEHSIDGAKIIFNKLQNLKNFGYFLAYPIAGHHTGLPDGDGDVTSLVCRLQSCMPSVSLPDERDDKIKNLFSSIREFFTKNTKGLDDEMQLGFAYQFLIRFLFSCLVDADFLDTESFMNPKNASYRKIETDFNDLKEKFLKKYNEKFEKENKSEINQLRKKLFDECCAKAKLDPGFFSLTMPTGSGKTLSSLGFALEHATTYKKNRIIYVIPYTSIIEQNAAVFRHFLGDEIVIEHHSHFDFDDNTNDELRQKITLATENWDAPVIVTTNVQFFETLFSHRVSRNRKLHNIANSVIIFDEVQMFPTDYLYPILYAVKELVYRYKCSIVFCSATQPAFQKRENFSKGIPDIREIVSDPDTLFNKMKEQRVQEKYLSDSFTIEQMGQRLIESPDSVLCIVSTRKKAYQLYQETKKGISDNTEVFYLSTYLCPKHRMEVLEKIKSGLVSREKKYIVISTQLVEAGVDLDFPVVYRELSGLDSLVQAAGRCNRNALYPNGMFYVFKWEDGVVNFSDFKPRAEETELIISGTEENFLTLKNIHEFYSKYFWRVDQTKSFDKKDILEKIKSGRCSLLFPFKSIGEEFHIIPKIQKTIFIPYDEEGKRLLCDLQRGNIVRATMRKAQQYLVQVYPHLFEQIAGYTQPLFADTVYLLEDYVEEIYNKESGLMIEKIQIEGEDLII